MKEEEGTASFVKMKVKLTEEKCGKNLKGRQLQRGFTMSCKIFWSMALLEYYRVCKRKYFWGFCGCSNDFI